MNDLPDPNVVFWIYSGKHKSFQYFGPCINTIFGHRIDHITDLNGFKALVYPSDQNKVLRHLKGGRSGNFDVIRFRIMSQGGKIKWLMNTAVCIAEKGNKNKFVAGFTQLASPTPSSKSFIPFEKPIPEILKLLGCTQLILNSKGEIETCKVLQNESALFFFPKSSNRGMVLNKVLKNDYASILKIKLKAFSSGNEAHVFDSPILLGNITVLFRTTLFNLDQDKMLVCIRKLDQRDSFLHSSDLFARMAEQSQQIIIVTDTRGTIQYVNKAFKRATGYSYEEAAGKNADFLKSPRQSNAQYQDLWKSLKHGESFNGEFYNLKKNKTQYIEHKTIYPLFDKSGLVTHFVSYGKDVTAEKNRERHAKRHDLLQVSIKEKEQKNRTLSLIKSNEIERRQLALEIHEGLNQLLSAAMLNIQKLKNRYLLRSEEKGQLEFIDTLVSEILQELRGISADLSPMALYRFGLHSSILQLVERNKLSNPAISYSFQSNTKDLRFKNEIEINYYRIVQEFIQNSIKHSQAKKLTVRLKFINNNLTLSVEDDGNGISLNNLEYKKMSTFGILNTEARVRSIGAYMKIVSEKNKGFKITISIQTKTINP